MYRKMYTWTLSVLLAFPASSARAAQPVEASVCEITAQPAEFEDVDVSVRGGIYAGMETTNISDASCPGAGIQLSVTEAISRHKDITAFERGIRRHEMHATATIVGRFHAKAPVYPFPMPAIDVHAIQNLVFDAK
jgi:hypothetical protein